MKNKIKLFAAFGLVTTSMIFAAESVSRNGREVKPETYSVATFDSGFGGFFTANEIAKQARALSETGYGPFAVVHYGDTLNIPYGEKTPEQIAQFAAAGIMTAFRDGAEDVFIACNTASTQIERIKEILRAKNPSYPNHVYSIINVSIKEAMKTISRKLKTQDVVTMVVMATPAAIRSENYPAFFAKALKVEFKPGVFTKLTQPRWLKSKGETIDSYTYVNEFRLGLEKKVLMYQMAPANWVDMIEYGAPDAEKLAAVKSDLAMLTSQFKPETVFDVVGEFCTHYPVFDAMIQVELRGLRKVAPDTPFIVQGPLMGKLFKEQFLQKKPFKSDKAVPPPSAPSIYLSGANIDATKVLVKKIFPNDPEPSVKRKEFLPVQ
ncbi:MAG: hypothetical protein PHR77_10580 [Kiritimatiellae bacterium]|nr:hypothetical protein [Kiritimatiellia bacterium]MDD5522391.1 hypothetical protein [Kiritimatiellia bacterium]